MSDSKIKQYKVVVSSAELDVLNQKLDLVRWPDEVEGVGWDYGVPLEDMKRLVEHWRNGFDWRRHEAMINELPQFSRDIDVEGYGTLNIHYIHQKSMVENAIPLLFLHGWPGHFLEVQKILPLLTTSSPDHPSFHVVAPSLPGFGFSEAPTKKGFNGTRCADLVHTLMLELGYQEYVVQGGDWGYFIARKLAGNYGGTHVKAWHTNFPNVHQPPSFLKHPLLWLQHAVTPYSQAERDGLERTRWFLTSGKGYHGVQSTTPQTLGYGLADSPVGLLAWIYEKLVLWSDDYPWTDDEVLAWVSVYWFSRPGPAASTRLYYERNATNEGEHKWSPIPCGISYFPRELVLPPQRWARTIGNVVYESRHGSGGHFAAHEKPHELVADVRAMFGKSGPAFGVVPDRVGYDPLHETV